MDVKAKEEIANLSDKFRLEQTLHELLNNID